MLLVTYPTFAFDYSVPCLLAFVPCLMYWAHLPGVGRGLGIVSQGAFGLFLVLASFSIYLFGSEGLVVGVYVITALGLMVASQCALRQAQGERMT